MLNTTQALRAYAVAAHDLDDAIQRDADSILKVSRKRKPDVINSFPYDEALAKIDELVEIVSQVRSQINGDLIEASFGLTKARSALKAAKKRVSGGEPLDDAQIVADAFRLWESVQKRYREVTK